MSIVVFIFLFLTCLFSALFLPVPFWWVLDAGRVLLVWSSGGLLLVWVQLHHNTVEKSLDAPQPGCTVYTITHYRLIPWSAFHCQHPRVCCTAVPLQMQLCSLSLMQFQFECGALCSLRCIRSLEKWSTTTVAGRWTAPPYSIIIITISLHHQMEHIISSS